MECLIVVKIEIYQRAITNLPILSDTPLVNDTFLKIENEWSNKKVFITRGKFMPEISLRQLGFRYSACGPFTKIKERIKK